MDDRDALAEMEPLDAKVPIRLATFDQYRSLLFSVAYRILGRVADAKICSGRAAPWKDLRGE